MAEGTPRLIKDERQDLYLKEFEENKKVSTKLLNQKERLPIFAHRNEILQKIRENQVVLIKGETGSGKTTQVPQYILEDCVERGDGSVTNILVTQPRRVSAVSVANRVAEERGEKIGKNSGRQFVSVGYEIRFEKENPRDVGSINFCTTGIVFNKLRANIDLTDVSHIILDEVHERDLFMDVLIGVLKENFIRKSKKLKVIIMSASLDVKVFQEFFGCPVFEIPGRCHPVERLYLEDFIHKIPGPITNGINMNDMYRSLMGQIGDQNDYLNRYDHDWGDKIFRFENADEVNVTFVTKLILDIHGKNRHNLKGALLVFLPGWDDISQIEENLTVETLANGKDNPYFTDDVAVFTLHSQVEMSKQVNVFKPVEKGMRKVILSTNIAETSVTIDDVVYVIDCGKINVLRYNPLQKASNLNMEWISQSNAQQRAGRAGRVQEGICWHLFSRLRKESLSKNMDPEIKRRQLEDVVLIIKSLRLPSITHTQDFMTNLVEHPSLSSVQDAVDLLRDIGALHVVKHYGVTHEESLTSLGSALSRIPLPPLLAKMALIGCFFNCLDPILSIVSILNEKDPFILRGYNKRSELDRIRAGFVNGSASDHIMFANVVHQWEKAYNSSTNQSFCAKHRLKESSLLAIYETKKQIRDVLDKLGYVTKKKADENRHNVDLIKGVIAYSLHPQVKKMEVDTKKGFKYLNDFNYKRIYLNQKSVNAPTNVRLPSGSYMAYFLARGNKKGNLQVHDCTSISQISALLFTPLGESTISGQIPQLRKKIELYVNNRLEKKASPNDSTPAEVIAFLRNNNLY